ncbi:oxidoreductase [Ktedonobacter sp. SOSP1-85]|uniref:Gfo/Idh/MocA family protein n=1 Tax=Ktedonobacter sp. SOSP1-85 TaxID=2778367 RepID=UPI001914DF8F|nr:Gfo/Idh/MocA family oxidoreductase [Ktedonobacter sp. SOSP1-85]GHO78763.1 oxidoreductase [Ktedonobacter sp. SOSP1-85]
MKKVTIALIGAGSRGMESYGSYALQNPYELEFVAVAEINSGRRAKFQQLHNLPAERVFADWRELLSQPKLADAVLICTQDRMHFEPAMAALQAGYHVLLEKPMSPDPAECVKMGAYAAEVGRVFSICHVLRFTSFFSTLKRLLDEGAIGSLVSIEHSENVAYWHYAHSYVRGNWRNTALSSPMILAKSCHDMDILLWLADANCTRLSSFGALTHFKSENAPPGAPMRCTDGCPAAHTCAYYAPKFYLTGKDGWPASVVSVDTSREPLMKALEEGPYGRCVYHCDNDVVDHQVVSLQFDNDVTAAFTMCAFTDDVTRKIKLMGTKGEMWGTMARDTNQIEVNEFGTGTHKVYTLSNEGGPQGHGGGDFGIIRDFLRLVRSEGRETGLTAAATSVQSHLLAFAAEEARLKHSVIEMDEYGRRWGFERLVANEI